MGNCTTIEFNVKDIQKINEAAKYLAQQEAAPKDVDLFSCEPVSLKSYIARINKLEEEKAVITQDIADIYTEAKSNGFHVPAMRQIIRIMKMDESAKKDLDLMVQLYREELNV